MASLVSRARLFATASHHWQVRKYTGEPYVWHPAAIAGMLESCHFRPEVIAAGWLHDVVEDCGVLESQLKTEFGDDVARLVMEVTDVSRPEHGNRATRKAIDRVHLSKASAEGQSIKLADLIDNTSSIVAHDPNFAKVYLAEKRALLSVLTLGHPDLIRRAHEQCGVD